MKRCVVGLCLCVVLLECKTRVAPSVEAGAPSASGSASRPIVDGGTHDIARETSAIVHAWNDAINAHDAAKLGTLYADTLDLYGQPMTRDRAIAAKNRAFAAHAHDELGPISVNDSGRATFTKKSTAKSGEVTNVIGYLVVANGKITTEGDTTTDANLARSKSVTCESAVSALALATAEAKRAEAEISASKVATVAGMVLPPDANSKADSQEWDVAVCENYPDRMPCYHHFMVNPVTGVVVYTGLYANDVGTNEPVSTDPALVAVVQRACRR